MLLTKLFTYIASTLLANILIVEILPPVYAKSGEPIESRNSLDKLALNPSFPTYTDDTLLQGNNPEIHPAQSNQGEVIPCPFTSNTWGLTTTTTITGIGQQYLIQNFDSRLIENDIEVLDGIEFDLDRILAHEFEQEGVLVAKCCPI
ncbi:hypothetical protein HUN01_00990 (plasmid) [Nostoc edaphicum CCNP1411]|uniref:Uncharacterized protein n=1 Tax=Nostoc edaphicum CCNP1411 TaxID=1472755 RepID=A0A7D7L917_9NOSO|nr:hypothetical protein [Nostoc edaphicum]QMS86228.1 hypothetical protein HUN01_00990 [Nostoc edaphicum CCNP1411]